MHQFLAEVWEFVHPLAVFGAVMICFLLFFKLLDWLN